MLIYKLNAIIMQAVDQFNNMQIYDGSHDVQLQISPDMIDDVLINIISHVSNGWKRQQEVRIYYCIRINFT